jgi:prevent-host-death family protein
MTASEMRQNFASTINRVAREHAQIIVEKNGVPVAAVIPIKDFRHLERLEARRREAWEALEAMRESFRDVSNEELEHEALKAVAEARAAMRAGQDIARASGD